MFRPFATVAMTSEPSRAPRTSPRPPKRLTPPMTAAEIESRSSVPPPALQVHRLEPRGEDDPADAGHDPGDREHEDPHARDVDAGAPRGLGVAADGVDVAPERRALREERQSDEEDEHEERSQRETLRLRAVHRERRALRARRRPRRVVADRDVPKHATATPASLSDRHPGVDGQARTSLADHAAQRDEGVRPGDDRGDEPADVGGEVVRRRVVDPVRPR